MNRPPPLQPTQRKSSKVPGQFETDDEQSPVKATYDDLDPDDQGFPQTSHTPPSQLEPALHHKVTTHEMNGEDSEVMDEQEMRKQLLDVESSFMPDHASDSIVASEDLSIVAPSFDSSTTAPPTAIRDAPYHEAHGVADFHPDSFNISSLETMSSSPTAAAAARTVSRVVSMASLDGYETARENDGSPDKETNDIDFESRTEHQIDHSEDDVATPKKGSPAQPSVIPVIDQALAPDPDSPSRTRRRPTYLTSRFSSNRASYSSTHTSTSNDLGSMLGDSSEYSLQAGGATSLGSSSTNGRLNETLSRSVSLGSMASGVSQLDIDGNQKTPDLGSLPEERSPPSSVLTTRKISHDIILQTPRGPAQTPDTITDTVLNQRVRDMEIPGTVVRNFARNFPERPTSPDKRSTLTTPSTGRIGNMTLKEQSGMIDKLQKENWQLKLKVYYMDQMLNARTDEGMKSIMIENVALKTEKLKLAKDLRDAKRVTRDLSAKLKDKDERLTALHNASKTESPSDRRSNTAALEKQITVLHERVETHLLEIEKLQEENAAKEKEKSHLAAVARSIGDQHRADSRNDSSKEVQFWKELTETESMQRQQVEEENRRLQDELWRLKSEGTSAVSGYRSDRTSAAQRRRGHSGERSVGTTASHSNSLLVEELRNEIEDLRRDLGAQTSMLTSRNREKEKLYQEIEELKMGHRQGRGSHGDIQDSATSRARGQHSRASSRPRSAHAGDSDSEALQNQLDELRDTHAKLSMENQDLSTSVEGLLDELEEKELKLVEYEKTKQEYDEFVHQTDAEILAMQRERDESLQAQEEVEIAFQDLRQEAQESINALEDELDHSTEAIAQLEQAIRQRNSESEQLRNQVRMAHEGLDKIEADVQSKVRRINELEMENQEITRELETIEESLTEANIKLEKSSVELESRQSECAFLREEQDGFVLKIGDLETGLKAAQTSLQSEKGKIKDLEARIAEERRQQELIGSKEKQQVQKIMNDLNRETAAAKDDARDLRKQLDTRTIELDSWKERLTELEAGLREALGDSHGKSNYIFTIMETQRKLEGTLVELSEARHTLSEKDRVLRQRDGLLENHGLEIRKLRDSLEKEKSARLTDNARNEHNQKTSNHSSRTINEKDHRISELEVARTADRKRLTAIEQKFKEQLTERNALLLSLWNKLAAVCGTDWQSQNSLVGGRLPSIDTIQNMLPGFSKNLLLAVKTIEQVIGSFHGRVKAVEKDLMKDYQQLEHNLNLRIKRLDRLESAVQHSRVTGVANAAPEIAKLRGENRMLKNEITTLQKQEQILRARQNIISIEPMTSANTPDRTDSATKAARVATASSLVRHNSVNAVETLQKGQQQGTDAMATSNQSLDASQARWIHRLKDLERRLKAEREARLQDRKGAKERLEKGEQENEELRAELVREKERNRQD